MRISYKKFENVSETDERKKSIKKKEELSKNSEKKENSKPKWKKIRYIRLY